MFLVSSSSDLYPWLLLTVTLVYTLDASGLIKFWHYPSLLTVNLVYTLDASGLIKFWHYPSLLTVNLVYTLDASGLIKFWHYPSQSCLSTIQDSKHTDDQLIEDSTWKDERQTLSSALSLTLRRFATTGADPGINIYDLETKKLISTCGPR